MSRMNLFTHVADIASARVNLEGGVQRSTSSNTVGQLDTYYYVSSYPIFFLTFLFGKLIICISENAAE